MVTSVIVEADSRLGGVDSSNSTTDHLVRRSAVRIGEIKYDRHEIDKILVQFYTRVSTRVPLERSGWLPLAKEVEESVQQSTSRLWTLAT